MIFSQHNHAVNVNIANWQMLEELVSASFAEGRGFALATLNLDHLTKLRRPGAFRDAYAAQDFVTADGNPIVWCSRLAGQPVELLPGSDMILPLVRLAAEMGMPLGLVGSTEASLAGAARALQHEVPGLEIAATIAPPMGFDPESEAADAILRDDDSELPAAFSLHREE